MNPAINPSLGFKSFYDLRIVKLEFPRYAGAGIAIRPFSRLSIAVDYTFGLLDISGFTAYCEKEGEHAAIEVLTRFRSLTRSVAVRRGVRVAKWLGDGVMLVAADQGPVVATVAEVVVRCDATGLGLSAASQPDPTTATPRPPSPPVSPPVPPDDSRQARYTLAGIGLAGATGSSERRKAPHRSRGHRQVRRHQS